jgi:hypothetical protein
MSGEVTKLYSAAEKKMLPLRNRIVEMIYESSSRDELTVAEVLGMLETIKLEIWLTELQD